ncbi:hypothetical protein IGI04_007488 [Brassica rapa subsp. trilocularis]|uniref:Uncharacterized protein n=1 Tax=Brassica rapa subsp. trilocularis TaxID=1813537 RepID=A0ABQ7NJY0_BRACM|nr:hypothetical protein IGI04_007488 [Brassica rapa subsp. trilocularis]
MMKNDEECLPSGVGGPNGGQSSSASQYLLINNGEGEMVIIRSRPNEVEETGSSQRNNITHTPKENVHILVTEHVLQEAFASTSHVESCKRISKAKVSHVMFLCFCTFFPCFVRVCVTKLTFGNDLNEMIKWKYWA